MKLKKLVRFYFSADSLERHLDNLIMNIAIGSGEALRGCEYFAERIIKVIEVKSSLARLWAGIDKVMSGLTDGDRDALKEYGSMRVGIRRLCDDKRRAIHRAAVKFSRRGINLLNGAQTAYRVLCEYYCLVSVGPDLL